MYTFLSDVRRDSLRDGTFTPLKIFAGNSKDRDALLPSPEQNQHDLKQWPAEKGLLQWEAKPRPKHYIRREGPGFAPICNSGASRRMSAWIWLTGGSAARPCFFRMLCHATTPGLSAGLCAVQRPAAQRPCSAQQLWAAGRLRAASRRAGARPAALRRRRERACPGRAQTGQGPQRLRCTPHTGVLLSWDLIRGCCSCVVQHEHDSKREDAVGEMRCAGP